MRSKIVLRNTTISMISYLLIIAIGFVSQRVFKDVLGQEYLGLHGLYSNIMSMLGIVELGFGSVIVVNMYKPVTNQNIPQIMALLQYYKKIYRMLAGLIFILGILILPFIDLIIGETKANINVKIVFCFYLLDTVFSYFMTYKRSILYANQENYYINTVHTVSIFSMNVVQIFVLRITHNYYLYLLLKIIFRLLENIVINIIANKKYTYITRKGVFELEDAIKTDISKKVRGLIFHKIGGAIVLGTDNIIISILPNLGLVWVGIYSNYLLIYNHLRECVRQIFFSITATVGILLVEESKEKSYDIFKKLLYFNAWIYTYISISYYFVSFSFIELWMKDKNYLLSSSVVLSLAINLFVLGMTTVYNLYKEAAGIFYEDRMIPIAESIVNIVISICLGYYLGIIGVFIGTICSNLIRFFFCFPRFIYKMLFDKSVRVYWCDLMKYVFIFVLCFFVTYMVQVNIKLNGLVYQLVFNIVVCFVISNSCFLLLTHKSIEYQFFKNWILSYLKKGKHKYM